MESCSPATVTLDVSDVSGSSWEMLATVTVGQERDIYCIEGSQLEISRRETEAIKHRYGFSLSIKSYFLLAGAELESLALGDHLRASQLGIPSSCSVQVTPV